MPKGDTPQAFASLIWLIHLYSLSYINFLEDIALFSIFSTFAFKSVICAKKLIGNLIKCRLMFMDEMASIAKNVQRRVNTALLHNPFLDLCFLNWVQI